MDATPARCLINSISRFVLLVSCQTKKCTPIQKDYRNMAMVLKHLKPVLDEILDCKLCSDELLCKEFEELDLAVNAAREFMENWCQKMSKICSVRRSEALYMKIRISSLKICYLLSRLLRLSPSMSSLTSLQHCTQEIHSLKQEMITEHIEEAVRNRKGAIVPCSDHLIKIVESLSLTSDQEILKESVAVEKERMNIQVNKSKGDLDQVNEIVDLIADIRNFLLKMEKFDPKSGVLIPSYFRCPLSLELMLDPVIVASGQTYERGSIQKWLENGLTICPKTRQTLAHTNLIANYTVKAMISSWCEENHVRPSTQGNATSTSVLLEALRCSDNLPYSLQSCNSTSKSSLEVGNGFEKRKVDFLPKSSREEPNGYEVQKTDSFGCPSHKLSYNHSRSGSASSAMSSIEYVPPITNEVSVKHEPVDDMSLSGEIKLEGLAGLPDKVSGCSPCVTGDQFNVPKIKADGEGNENREENRIHAVPLIELGCDDLTSIPHVKSLIEGLKSQSNELQTAAAEELRLLAKNKMENRVIIGHCGAIAPLVSLLYSGVKLTQEHAVTALLNLSINDEVKSMIAEAGAVEPLIHVLKSGNDGARENAAASLFSLSLLGEYKAKIGRSGAVKALVDLLASGTLRGKKDAATALFNLSILHENKARIVQAGAVKYLVELLDPATGMIDKAVALLANLSTIGEGRLAIVRAGGIPSLVEIVESGSQRGKENAASVLLQLCLDNPKFCTLVLQEGAVPPLVALSQFGTLRAKEKAQQLLSHFRNQREASMGKGK